MMRQETNPAEREILCLLLEEMEAALPMAFAPPCMRTDRLAELPASLSALYSLTDGMEINVPGTVILPLEELPPWTRETQRICFGHMNFGDLLCMDAEGRVYQIDIEDGAEFLSWDSLFAFLKSEYESGVMSNET